MKATMLLPGGFKVNYESDDLGGVNWEFVTDDGSTLNGWSANVDRMAVQVADLLADARFP